MSFRLSVLTLLRSPVKTLITFALLVATSFAFVSRGVEFFTTEQVITDTESEYVAVGTIVSTEERFAEMYGFLPRIVFGGAYGEASTDAAQYFCPIEQEAIDLVLSTDYIARSEVRHVAGGVTSDELWTVLEKPTPYNYAGLVHHELGGALAEVTWLNDHADADFDGQSGYSVFFKLEELLAGDPELWESAMEPEVYYDSDGEVHGVHPYVPKIIFSGSLNKEIITGERALVLLSAIDKYATSDILGQNIFSGDFSFPSFVNLTCVEEENGEVSYEDYAPLVEGRYGTQLAENLHKPELVFTSDMSLLPRFHDNTLYITEGRMLTAEDTGSVCVINSEYAERNGLSVGDTIDFDVDPNTMVYFGKVFARDVYDYHEQALGAAYTEYDLERESRSYEIVGIWAAPPADDDSDYHDADILKYPLNTVFVPDETYPWADEVEPHIFPATFSFELKHPGDMSALEYELGDKLEEMGYRLIINDLGYANVEQSFSGMRTSALVGFVAMAAALLLSLVLIVYLFIIRRKSEYAVMRALGVSAKRASRSLLAGLSVLSGVAIIVGCIAALITSRSYAVKLAQSTADLTGQSAGVYFSPLPAVVLGVAVLALLLIFAFIGLRIVGRKSPLELLQGKK